MTTTAMPEKRHHGRAVKRIREILHVKQDTLADALGISQQSVSLLETKETIDPETLESIAKTLKVPVEAIKNFDDDATFNIISNTFSDFKDHAVASALNYQCSFNPIDKIVELYEALVKSEREKIELMQKILDKMK